MDKVRRIIHPVRKIISDTTKFEPINEDLMLLRGSQLFRLLRNRKANGHVDANIYSNIYGLPEMHYLSPFDPILCLRSDV